MPTILLFTFLPFMSVVVAQENVLDTNITLARQNTSIYLIFHQISRQTGYYFIYDSELLDSDKKVRIRHTTEPLKSFLKTLLEEDTLDFKVVGQHILILQKSTEELASTDTKHSSQNDYHVIQGRVLDLDSGSPLAYASVGLPAKGIGVPSNTEGYFRITVPDSLTNDSIRISYMGYKTRHIPVGLLMDHQVDIRLQTDYISMQEVIIRYYDPMDVIKEALEMRENNMSNKPAYLMSFYREGVQKKSDFLNYSEAVFKIYKSPYLNPYEQDQAMVLKSRNITNRDHTDTLLLKLKAGVKSSLELDIMKNLPDFLDPEFFQYYEYSAAGLVSLHSRLVYVIDFQQLPHITEPLYKGTLYIDKENLAFVKVDFEINPRYLHKVSERFVVKKTRHHTPHIQEISYTVSYQAHEGYFYLNHVRGDIHLKIRRRNQLFGKDYHLFLEMAISHIETEDVNRFRRREAFQTNAIFSEKEFQYDYNFWGDYNIITPETHINDALREINSRIESLSIEN